MSAQSTAPGPEDVKVWLQPDSEATGGDIALVKTIPASSKLSRGTVALIRQLAEGPGIDPQLKEQARRVLDGRSTLSQFLASGTLPGPGARTVPSEVSDFIERQGAHDEA